MLFIYYEEKGIDIEISEIKQYINSHQILIAIENIQGHLLEEYLASVLCKQEFGFIWCDGKTIKAADFCKRVIVEGKPQLILIQREDKYYTENSSSSKIRDNTPIKKWYRLGKLKDENQKNKPSYKWCLLNNIVEDITNKNPELNEGYI